MRETRFKNVGMTQQQIETEPLHHVGNSWLFKLRDSVGSTIAILGHDDITLSQLAINIQEELDRRFPL